MRIAKQEIMHKAKKHADRFLSFFKWLIIAGVIGIVVGQVGSAFYYGMHFATEFRVNHPIIMIGLPFGGLFIVFLYHIAGRDADYGTNSVLAAVRSEERLGIMMAPLIFVGTTITHLFGGSSGREGAALQIGGSIGSGIGDLFRLNETDKHVAIMCGMSACFAALFGTPIAATFFAMEVVSVGVMYYSALVPCVFSSLIAVEIARYYGVMGEEMTIMSIPDFTMTNVLKIILLSILCAILSRVFCQTMHMISHYAQQFIKNAYGRIFVFGSVIALIHFLIGSQDYAGAGMEVIERAIHGEVNPEAFLLKLLLTALTLGVGYKGGEIVPSFYVGATFGCLIGQYIGISPSMCAAVGMIALFCGVTNSPITSLLLAFELFGMNGIYFSLIGVAVSYMLSGYYSLYQSQKIVYSKYNPRYRGEK